MNLAGYSGTPLEKKLGLKEDFVVRLINPPEHYFDLFWSLPASLQFSDDPLIAKDFIHFFTMKSQELERNSGAVEARNKAKRHDLGQLAQEGFKGTDGCDRGCDPKSCLVYRTCRCKGLRC